MPRMGKHFRMKIPYARELYETSGGIDKWHVLVRFDQTDEFAHASSSTNYYYTIHELCSLPVSRSNIIGLKNSSSIYIVLPKFPHCKCAQIDVLKEPGIPVGYMETALPSQKGSACRFYIRPTEQEEASKSLPKAAAA